MLQYIVGGSNAQEIINTATSALDNGCRWIRLDLSELTPVEIEFTVKSLQEKCIDIEAFLSLENDVENVATMKTAGLHLGESSMNTATDARKRLGEEPIIGITIKESADVPFVPRNAIDYVAVNGSDLKNCRKIVQQMRDSNFDEPVVATLTPDISLDQIMATGVGGIAVHHNTTPPAKLEELLKKLNTLVEQRLEEL